MNRISTYFPVASKELHAVVEMSGVEPENSGDVIHVDDDSAFSAYRDNAEDSDSSDVEGYLLRSY